MSSLSAKTPSNRFLQMAGAAGLALATAVGALGLTSRVHSSNQNAQWATAQSVPTVGLARIQPASASDVTLPGTVQPFEKAQIFARVSGYLKSWNADIGAQVKAGQTLAVIDAPDLDQQLAQAKGDLATARANARLADLTAKRWAALKETGAVSQQVIDEKAGDRDAKLAVVDAARAKLRGIEAIAAYKRIASPFDGIVTARKTDVGALINAGSAGQELFEVSDLRRLRIYVQVPQALAASLVTGQVAEFALPESPGQTVAATVTAISHALDPATRTMLVQLQAANPGSAIGAGSYCQVSFHMPSARNVVRVPATALVVTNAGPKLAILGADNRVSLRSVKLGLDYGDTVDVVAGLAPRDRIIDTPPETLRTGDFVRVATPPLASRGA